MLRGMRIRIRRPAALRLLIPVLGALTTGAAALSGAQAPTGAPARPAMYTDAQAAMGETLYRQSCAACHGATLTGGTAPPLAGPTFDTSWSDPRVTIADVFFIARTTMPPRASNTLTAQDHAAVFAYLLKMNGFPAGATPLTATSEALESAHVAIANQAARPAAPEFIPGAAAAAPACRRARGVAIRGGRVFRGARDGELLALNSETGAQLWARRIGKPADGEIFVMARVVFEERVLIGPALSERNVQGWVGAFRASDGTPIWRFNTVPKAGEPGFDTWKNPKGIPMGGGAVWPSLALDTENGDLHVAVTNPAPDLPVHLRQGANLYTNSIVVLDARTGRLRWYRQLVPNDSHD